MLTKNRSTKWMIWAGALFAVVLLSGCIVHTHPGRYNTSSYTATAGVGYYDGHVIPDRSGGGWCYVDGQHNHTYQPDYRQYYTSQGGNYRYQGPVSFYFYGSHPEDNGRTCRISGRHIHHYRPSHDQGWRYHTQNRYYYYDTAPRRGKVHPAEPAYRTHAPTPRGRAAGAASSGRRATPAVPAVPHRGGQAATPAIPATPGHSTAASPATDVRGRRGGPVTEPAVPGAGRGSRATPAHSSTPTFAPRPARPATRTYTPAPTYTPTPAAQPARVLPPTRPLAPVPERTNRPPLPNPRPAPAIRPPAPAMAPAARTPTPTARPAPVTVPTSRPGLAAPRVSPRRTGTSVRGSTQRSGGTVRPGGNARAEKARKGDREAASKKKEKDAKALKGVRRGPPRGLKGVPAVREIR